MPVAVGPLTVQLNADIEPYISALDRGIAGINEVRDLLGVPQQAVAEMLGDLVEDIPIALFMIDEEFIGDLKPQLDEARARNAGIKEICRILNISWSVARLIPFPSCCYSLVEIITGLGSSTFCQTFPKDPAQHEHWTQIVTRGSANVVWLAHNALRLIEETGGFETARDVADYVGEAHVFPKSKKCEVVIRESREWHAGRLRPRRPNPRHAQLSIGADLAADPDVTPITFATGGYISTWRPPNPEIVAHPGAVTRLCADDREGRVTFNGVGERSFMGLKIRTSPYVPEDTVYVLDSITGEPFTDLHRSIQEEIARAFRVQPEDFYTNPGPIVYPFEDLLPIDDAGASLVILKTWGEFQEESEMMNHCVGRSVNGRRYFERASNFEILIGSVRMLRRRHPLATIEFSMEGNVLQIRGANNDPPDKEDSAIVNRMIALFRKKIDFRRYNLRPRTTRTFGRPSYDRRYSVYGGDLNGERIAMRGPSFHVPVREEASVYHLRLGDDDVFREPDVFREIRRETYVLRDMAGMQIYALESMTPADVVEKMDPHDRDMFFLRRQERAVTLAPDRW